MNILNKNTSNLDLYQYAEDNNIIIEHLNLKQNKSLSARIRNRDFIGLDNSILNGSATERTHLAHELGHCATGSFYEIESPLQVRGQYEYRAQKWAVLRLIPKVELLHLLKKNTPKWEIAEHFGISEQLIDTAITYYFEYEVIK